MYRDINELSTLYLERLKRLNSLWTHASHQGLCDAKVLKSMEDVKGKLENAATQMIEKHIQLEKTRQEVMELKSALDISKQTVEAKWKHLGQEEKQKEEEQALRFKEFQRIKKLKEERDCLLRDVVPIKERLARAMETLDEKSEKLRNMENFHGVLAEHCAMDICALKDQTDESRLSRTRWDRSALDLTEEIMTFPLDLNKMVEVDRNVSDLKAALYNHRQWYEDELETKLFRATQSKEIKHQLNALRTLLSGRHDKQGASDEFGEEERQDRKSSRRSEHLLVDGLPAVQAKEVERYLSQQFGMRVLADYTMLRRLKDEIGIQGLAYLVEKVRLQSGPLPQNNVSPNTHPMDWEEHRIHQALMNIANEYRDDEENKRLLRVPVQSSQGLGGAYPRHSPVSQLLRVGLTTAISHSFHQDAHNSIGPFHEIDLDDLGTPLTPTRSSSSSQVPFNLVSAENATEQSFDLGSTSGQRKNSTTGSLKKYNSLAKIKKFLKL